MDSFFLAASKLRRKRYDECIAICDQILEKQNKDEAAWFLKCRALTLKCWIDDLEIDEGAIADNLDEASMNANARPGTSFMRPGSSRSGPSQAIRPVSRAGRPISGFARPGSAVPQTASVEAAIRGRTGQRVDAPPMTSSGRFLRLSTASMIGQEGQLFDTEKMNIKEKAKKSSIAKALCDYLIYTDHKVKEALNLCEAAIKLHGDSDWWWQARKGKCLFYLDMQSRAVECFTRSLSLQRMSRTYTELCKSYVKQDQPMYAIEKFKTSIQDFPYDESLKICLARIYDLIDSSDESVTRYKEVLITNPCNIEAIASIAAYNFYSDRPEVSLRFYRRLLQLGITGIEIWNNLGLACYYAGQYDIAMKCFERTFELSDNSGDVWYNLSIVALGMGDLTTATYALKLAVNADPSNGEAHTNLGVLEMRKGNFVEARASFLTAVKVNAFLYEPHYNLAYLAYSQGNFQESYANTTQALVIYPEHSDSKQLLKLLQDIFDNL
jgi:tetratricopeptide repeat protein 8